MGQQSSTQKVHAEMKVPAGFPLVDTLTMSCITTRCWGRGKFRLAKYTFPRKHWVSSQGVMVCRSTERQKLPFAKMRRMDPDTNVEIKCILRGALVDAASAKPSVTFARLMGVRAGTAGEDAALLFSLAGGEDAAADRGAANTALSCLGRLYGGDGNAGEDGCQGDAERLSHWEDGCGAPASPGDQHLVGRQQQPDLPPQSEDPATASLALGADDHLLDQPAEELVASDDTRSHKNMTAVELQRPVWRTPICDMEARTRADALLPPASVPALVPELKPHHLRPPDSDQMFTVPKVCCKDPSASPQDSEVPDYDLGESLTLAFYLEHCVRQDSATPETNLGELQSLEFYETGPKPDSYGEVQPSSAQDREAAPAEDLRKPVPSPQAEESLESGELWGRAILDILAVVHMVGSCLMILYTLWV